MIVRPSMSNSSQTNVTQYNVRASSSCFVLIDLCVWFAPALFTYVCALIVLIIFTWKELYLLTHDWPMFSRWNQLRCYSVPQLNWSTSSDYLFVWTHSFFNKHDCDVHKWTLIEKKNKKLCYSLTHSYFQKFKQTI